MRPTIWTKRVLLLSNKCSEPESWCCKRKHEELLPLLRVRVLEGLWIIRINHDSMLNLNSEGLKVVCWYTERRLSGAPYPNLLFCPILLFSIFPLSQCCWYIIDHQLSSEGVPQPHPKRLPRQRAQSCRLEKINSGLQSELWMKCWNKWNFSWRLLNGRCKIIKILTGEMMWYFSGTA